MQKNFSIVVGKSSRKEQKLLKVTEEWRGMFFKVCPIPSNTPTHLRTWTLDQAPIKKKIDCWSIGQMNISKLFFIFFCFVLLLVDAYSFFVVLQREREAWPIHKRIKLYKWSVFWKRKDLLNISILIQVFQKFEDLLFVHL